MFGFFGYTLALSLGQLVALALVAVGLLAIAHLVGRRRRRVVVSTADPWSPAQRPARRSSLGWRMQRWLMFLLHAAIALLVVLALADPSDDRSAWPGDSVLVLLDTSASMGTITEGKSRLDRAREAARIVLSALGPDDCVMVAGFARQLEPESGWTQDRRAISGAIARVATGGQAEDLPGAVRAATALLEGHSRPKIVAIGDRPPDEASRILSPRPSGVTVDYISVGAPADNVGLTGLAVARSRDDSASLEAWLTLQSSAEQPSRSRIELASVASGRVLAGADVDLPARGSRTVRVSFPGAGESAVAAVVRAPPPGVGNALLSDDRAEAALPPTARRRVLLVSEGNRYLEGALRSFGAGLELHTRTTSRLRGGDAELSGYDVVVFDGPPPQPTMRLGRALYLDPAGAGSPFASRGLVRDPVPTQQRRNHPLLRHVSLADLNIREARRLVVEPDDLVVVAALDVPLILARETADLRAVALAFDLRRSDLPLRPSLPLLLANALDWLAGSPGQPVGGASRPLVDPAEGDTYGARSAKPAPPSPAPARLAVLRPSRLSDLFLLMALALGLGEWWLHQRRWKS